MANYYNQYRNDYYNPDDDERKPGLNDNWRQIQKGFHQVEGEQEYQDERMMEIEGKNTEQDGRLTAAEGRLTTAEGDIEDLEEDIANGPAVLKMTLAFTGMTDAIPAGDTGGIDMLIAESNKDTLLNYEGADTFLVVVGIRATASYTDLTPEPVRVKIAAELPVCYNVVTKTQINSGCTVGVYLRNGSSLPVTIADDTVFADFYFIPIGG